MKQIEFFEIENPCIGVCQNGPRGYCLGCFRSREERQHWNVLEQDVKRKIIKACAQRGVRARLAAKQAKLKQMQASLEGVTPQEENSPQDDLF